MKLVAIDLARQNVNICGMESDDALARTTSDPLTRLVREDLDPLSVDELRERLDILGLEMARVQQKIEGAVTFRAGADSLFKR